MKNIKRYACNRLYVGEKVLLQSVVEINDKGWVECYMPLTQETPATEWIGGVIILSGNQELPLPSDFKSILQESVGEEKPMYAWHISNFDFQQEALTSASIIRRL